jgi:hypothetical protein
MRPDCVIGPEVKYRTANLGQGMLKCSVCFQADEDCGKTALGNPSHTHVLTCVQTYGIAPSHVQATLQVS